MANLHSALAEEAKSEARAKTAFVLATFYVSLAAGSCLRAQPTVVLFVVDGLQNDAAQIAAANGATHLKFFLHHGVRVEEALCTSPSAVVILPDSSRPWGTAAPPNVAMHTGTHVFESRAIDDVFLAARRSGIRSVFAGSADNYNVFTSADFHHARSYTDSFCVAFAVEHLVRDTVRLFSIHLQELRRAWKGPAGKVDPLSSYQQSLLHADRQLGRLIDAVKSAGRWESTYVVIASDHGMGTTERSDHPASEPTSWRSFMCFYGPGIRQGATIPYAETPDIAVLISGKRRDESLLVVALRRSPIWKWEHLRTWSGRTGGCVETLSAGRYESAFPVGEIGEVEQHQSALPGVAFGDIDASCVVYFRTRDRWVHLWLSD